MLIQSSKYIKASSITACIFLLAINSILPVYAQVPGIAYLINTPDNPAPLITQVINQYMVSPDSSRVVFTSTTLFQNNLEFDTVSELFSVPIEGGPIVKISGDILLNRGVSDFKISPDSKTVVFRADLSIDNQDELYSVPIQGGAIRRLSQSDLTPSEEVDDFEFAYSSNASKVVFTVEKRFEDDFSKLAIDLFSVGIDGTQRRRISQANNVIFPLRVKQFKVSPDGQQVAYSYQPGNIFSKADLFIADAIFETAPIKLSVPRSSTVGGVSTSFSSSGLQFDAVGARVLFRQSIDGESKLYSVSSGGGEPAVLQAENTTPRIQSIRTTADGSNVVYALRRDIEDFDRIASIPITGGELTFLGITSRPNSIQLISNDTRVLFYLETAVFGGSLMSVPIDGSEFQSRLASPGGSRTSTGELSSDGRKLVYPSRFLDKPDELRVISLNEGSPTTLATDASNSLITHDSKRVIYLDIENRFEPNLKMVSIKGGAASNLSRNASSDLDEMMQSYSIDYSISSNSKFVVFRMSSGLGEFNDRLYAVKLPDLDDDLCLPIKASNGNIAIICL